MGICSMAQTKTGAQYEPKGGGVGREIGGSSKGGDIYMTNSYLKIDRK